MPLLPPLEKTLPLESVSGENHYGSIPYSLKRERDIATAGEARESAGALLLDVCSADCLSLLPSATAAVRSAKEATKCN